MNVEQILNLTKLIIGDLKPDLTFYLKLTPEEAFKRKSNINERLDRIEKEGLEFHKLVQKGYDYISKIESERFITIDATKSPEEISKQIITLLQNKLNH